ncbi:MAG: C2 family cysteine protease [Planctomycetota bacterium]|nr:C2 family cysteine protease [Planctomycetota bacterium]
MDPKKNTQTPTLDSLEPRLLLSGTSVLADLFSSAVTVDLLPAGRVAVTGQIAGRGDMAMYKFTGQARGGLSIDATASGSGLDPYLEIYNQKGRRIRRNDNVSRKTTDSRTKLSTKPSEVLYALVRGARGSLGDYDLLFTADAKDDCGNTIETAKPIRIGRTGKGRAAGQINYATDQDMMVFVAPKTGTMTVHLFDCDRRNVLDTELSVYDADGNLLEYDDDGGLGTNSRASFDVTAGQSYYLCASGVGTDVGRYRMMMTTETPVIPPEPDPDPEPDPEPTPDPNPDYTPGSEITATTYSNGGSLQLIVLGTDGQDDITLSASLSAITMTTAAGSEVFGGSFAAIVLYSFDGNDTICLRNSVLCSSVIYAGGGNDTVFEASQGSAAIFGGDGDDLLISVGGGTDAVSGEAGMDSFWADGADSLGDTSSAEQAAGSVHSITEFYQPYTTNRRSASYVSLEIAGQNFTDPTVTYYATGYNNFADRPLFADGPQYSDINQGAVGDCYYLAALASLADTDADLVQQMITPLGDGTYAMRYYRGGEEVFLRLDADLPVNSGGYLAYADFSDTGEIWVPLMEKAYAYFRTGDNSYASISGGWMEPVYEEVTGVDAQSRSLYGSAHSIYNYLNSQLNSGHAVTMGSWWDASSPVVGSHAYMVKSVESLGGELYVTVYNPWGVDGRSWDSNYRDGLLTLSMDMVQDAFMAITVSTA